jgi:hypothetical protein
MKIVKIRIKMEILWNTTNLSHFIFSFECKQDAILSYASKREKKSDID